MDEAALRALKMSHNALNQRAMSVLALAELVQDYRSLAAQLLAQLEMERQSKPLPENHENPEPVR